MLTLAKCRQILGGKSDFSDAELTVLRDNLQALADLAIDALSSLRQPTEMSGCRSDRPSQRIGYEN